VQHACRFGWVEESVRLSSVSALREAYNVDLAVKLNVLAVCAAIIFVSAILLGMF
jgi:hypothetical protein